MRVLITGHTGFKGAWLSLMMSELGYELHGLSDTVMDQSLYKFALISEIYSSEHFADICNPNFVEEVIKDVRPELIVHLAAQSLVLEGYRAPFKTFATNLVGTFNVVHSASNSNIDKLLVVTSDKVYRNQNEGRAFTEDDPLGGTDPYSASKAAADILTQSLSGLIQVNKVSIVRAGNVIGGGDFGADRLIPDLYRAQVNNRVAQIRFPGATRPWQHVLDCLNGYLRIIENLETQQETSFWNIGPKNLTLKTVADICNYGSLRFNNPNLWKSIDNSGHISRVESNALSINSLKANRELGWEPKMDFDTSIEWTFDWYSQFITGVSAKVQSRQQLRKFLEL